MLSGAVTAINTYHLIRKLQQQIYLLRNAVLKVLKKQAVLTESSGLTT